MAGVGILWVGCGEHKTKQGAVWCGATREDMARKGISGRGKARQGAARYLKAREPFNQGSSNSIRKRG